MYDANTSDTHSSHSRSNREECTGAWHVPSMKLPQGLPQGGKSRLASKVVAMAHPVIGQGWDWASVATCAGTKEPKMAGGRPAGAQNKGRVCGYGVFAGG